MHPSDPDRPVPLPQPPPAFCPEVDQAGELGIGASYASRRFRPGLLQPAWCPRLLPCCARSQAASAITDTQNGRKSPVNPEDVFQRSAVGIDLV